MVQGRRSKDEMHAETLAHSTKQMCKTRTCWKLGGGKKRVYVCATPGRYSCPYRIMWTQKVLGGRIDCSPKEYKRMNKGHGDKAWRLNLDECVWVHDMWCTSKQNVRVAELTSDSTFVEDMNTFGTDTTGKCSAQSSFGRGGRVAGGSLHGMPGGPKMKF